jgi:hypothetical protein
MHIPTRRGISTTGTITAMSKILLVFFLSLYEQYVSVTFEHRGLPSNLVTKLNNIHKISSIDLCCSTKYFLHMNKLHGF